MLEHLTERRVTAGEIVFRTGDPGDALYVVAEGKVEVLDGDGRVLAALGEGQAFGEMALLSSGTRTATVRAQTDALLLAIAKADFDSLRELDPFLDEQVRKLSHERALSNLRAAKVDPARWAKTARDSIDSISRSEEHRLLMEAKAGRGAGLAIVFGNILDTIPGCLVIGAKFAGYESLSVTLIIGMFLGGIPEAAASAGMLRRAGFSNRAIFLLWSTVLVAGVVAAMAGKAFISGEANRCGARPGGGGRRHPGAGHPRHDPGSAAQGRLRHRPAGGRRLPDGPLSRPAGARAGALIRRRRPIAENSSRRPPRSAAVAPPRGRAVRNVRDGAR